MFPFKPEKADLGMVSTNSRHEIVYNYDENIDNIFQVVTPCSCSSATIDKTKRQIKVTYISGGIPKQLKDKGLDHYSTKKSITVTYSLKDSPGKQKVATLYFTATVKER